jgi:hypothetical protein
MEMKELIEKISGKDKFMRKLYRLEPAILTIKKTEYGDYIVYYPICDKFAYGSPIDGILVALFGKTNFCTHKEMGICFTHINKYQAETVEDYIDGVIEAQAQIRHNEDFCCVCGVNHKTTVRVLARKDDEK